MNSYSHFPSPGITFIAELGINHNGSLSLCKELIDLAASCGCDAVKLQKRNIDKVYTSEFLNSYRESPWGTTQRDQKLALEFELDDYIEIDSYCRSVGIPWFASAWDLDSQNFIKQFNCPFNKIASAMIVYEPLLKAVASEGKHTFISTGMSTLSDIDLAVNIFRQHDCSFELMHTVSTYPMRDEDANLLLIPFLRERYNCAVGYSGHEVGLAVSYAACALGITSLERHITLDRAMYGSDQPSSLEPAGLRQLTGGIRKIQYAMGDGLKKTSSAESLIADKLRGHLGREADG